MDNKTRAITSIFGIVGCLALLLSHVEKAFAWSQDEIISEAGYSKVLSYVDVSQEDLDNYKKLFQAIEADNIKAANLIFPEIKNEILMGHALAEKFFSPKYTSTVKELSEWLGRFSDHPQAKRIYKLYVKKGGKNTGLSPDRMQMSADRSLAAYSWYAKGRGKIKSKHVEYLRGKTMQFKTFLKRGSTKNARIILEDKQFKKAIPEKDYDSLRGTLARVYFLDNRDDLALEWSEPACSRSADAISCWIAGIASYRMANYTNAVQHFSKLGRLDDDEWLVAAGAFWAYRSHMKLDQSGEAKKWLKYAARYKRTFHGILANHKLGSSPDYNFDGVAYFNNFNKNSYLDELLVSPSIQRGIVLLSIENYKLAEKEFGSNYMDLTDKQKEVILYIASQYKMHNLGIKISNHLQKSDKEMQYDSVAYPVPDWEFEGGWKVEKPFVLALVRQESAFHPGATSRAGARGLMQVMPNTAIHVTKNRSLKRDRRPLLEEEYNLSVGQNYVQYLLGQPYIDGNLFFLMVAYNAGPGNLLKWKKRMNYDEDPLMFIETIPARETRLYIKRVMANYWMYNIRFGVQSNSLKQLADNAWPTF